MINNLCCYIYIYIYIYIYMCVCVCVCVLFSIIDDFFIEIFICKSELKMSKRYIERDKKLN